MKFKLLSKYPKIAGSTSTQLRKYIWVALVGIIVLSVVAFRWGPPWLNQRMEDRSLRRMESYLAQKDYRRAQLTLEQAVQVNPESLELRQRLAIFYTRVGSPRALEVWSQLVEREPENVDHVLNKAKAALMLGDVALLKSSLALVSAGQRNRPEYLRLRAALALAEEDSGNLRSSFALMEEMMPDDRSVKFGVSALAMQGEDPSKMQAAREELLALAKTDSLRIRATLQLIEDAGRHADPSLALVRLAQELTGALNSGDDASLVLLNFMQAQPEPHAGDVAVLMDWMVSRGMPREALWWLDGLEESLVSTRRVLRAMADCQARLRQWENLEHSLAQGAWGAISPEVLRLLFLARGQFSEKERARALETWMAALDLISKTRGASALMIAERLANYWNWDSAREKTLWRGQGFFPENSSYLHKLAALAEAARDSASLAKVYRAWTENRPDDYYAWASRLYLEMLRGHDLSELQSLSTELMSRPDILPEVAIIWAWTEAKLGRGALAMERLSALGLDYTGRPRAALLYTALLLELDLRHEALESWLQAKQFAGTLSEEKALIAEIASRLR